MRDIHTGFENGYQSSYDSGRVILLDRSEFLLEISSPPEYSELKAKHLEKIENIEGLITECNNVIANCKSEITKLKEQTTPETVKKLVAKSLELKQLAEEKEFEIVAYNKQLKEAQADYDKFKEKYQAIYEKNRKEAVESNISEIENQFKTIEKLHQKIESSFVEITKNSNSLINQFYAENRGNTELILNFNDVYRNNYTKYCYEANRLERDISERIKNFKKYFKLN